MEMKIHKRALLQYFTIYIMLVLNQSNLFQIFIFGNTRVTTFIVAAELLYLIVKYRKKARYGILFTFVLLCFVVFARFMFGDIGIEYWYEMAEKILIVFIAILVDPDHFLSRFIKTVVFFAGVSIIFWLFQATGNNLQSKFLPSYRTGGVSVSYDYYGYGTTNYMTCNGLLLCSYITNYAMRNVGIFTEPGIYQMVLISALYILLYFKSYCGFSDKQEKRYFIVLTIALFTTQSTTGYLAYFVLLLCKVIQNGKSADRKWKERLLVILGIIVIALAIDYSIRGEQSFLYTTLIIKLFDANKRISLVAEHSTGQYRVATTLTAIQAVITHPMGLGLSGWNSFSSINNLAGAGGFPFRMGAIIGIAPLVISLIWIFYPLKYTNNSTIEKLVFVFLYFNTTLAQTSAFYPTLILIPLIYYFVGKKSITEYENTLLPEQ